MKFPRASGIILHPTSLPCPHGIGDLGVEAYRFADFLIDSRQRLWQMLPLNPAGYGDSPYQTLSVFAGNPLLISLDKLAEQDLLKPSDLEKLPQFPAQRVDYDAVRQFKLPLLKESFKIFEKKATGQQKEELESFCAQKSSWLDDFALFMSLKEAHSLTSWNTWEEDIRQRQPKAIKQWSRKLESEIRYYKYQQWLFFKQWGELKHYCNEHGIRLMGDVPIFVSLDSVTVWVHPEMFYLDASGHPTVVAGVPPDYFSRTGQLWGNPLYRWDVMAQDGYSWWIERFRATREFMDVIRLDHFRGFEKYWQVPATDKTAINGTWVEGPGAPFFEAVQNALGELPIVAEDLGVITPEVDALRDRFGFAGMRVLQFAFGNDPKADDYKPHSYIHNCVAYSGTHDNNTTIGWFKGEDIADTTQSRNERYLETQLALKYTGTDGREINWDFIRLASMSVADTAIYPLQDILGLGSEGRMNRPGSSESNWKWRFTSSMLTLVVIERLREMTVIYGRAA